MGVGAVMGNNESGLPTVARRGQAQAGSRDDDSSQDRASTTVGVRSGVLRSQPDCNIIECRKTVLERNGPCDENTSGPLGPETRAFEKKTHLQPWSHARAVPESPSERRRCSLQLPSFKTLGISSTQSPISPQTLRSAPAQPTKDTMLQAPSSNANQIATILSGTLAPLTPPPEDIRFGGLDNKDKRARSDPTICSNSCPDDPNNEVRQVRQEPDVRSRGIALPRTLESIRSSSLRGSPWISKAIHKIVTSLESATPLPEIQMVSQTLPSQAKDGRSRPTFEELLEALQTDLDPSPYITVTHAVPQARVMEELPKTPPSTPGARREISDYFGEDQTIFTHAAVVPIYHSHARTEKSLGVGERFPHHIAAPYSVKVSILERYMPPTMSSEIDDFFSISPRSYLADRLSELSADHGSLLLVYPTHAGGRTFTRNYLSPVIDPFLRQFVMLNDLTTFAASLMGNMTAVDNMIDFEEMQRRMEDLCLALSERPPVRGRRSAYKVTYAEASSVVLDRSTWLGWYIEQEQSRLRQNLVQYHQNGGRMPRTKNHQEVTVGMLTRDFIDGIRRSEQSSGGVGIEVGVFIVTRSTLS